MSLIRAGEHVVLEPVEDPQRRIFAKAAKGERIKYRRKHFAGRGCGRPLIAIIHGGRGPQIQIHAKCMIAMHDAYQNVEGSRV